MKQLVTLLSWSITLLCPIYLLDQYLVYVYLVSLIDYWHWLVSASGGQYFSIAPFIISLVLLIAVLFWFRLFVDGLFSKLWGNRNDYIYLGNNQKFSALYLQDKMLNVQLYKVTSPDIEYNFSFDNVGRKQRFVKHDGDISELGASAELFTLGRLFTYIWISGLFIIPLMGTLHACISALKQDLTPTDVVFSYDWKSSFDSFWGHYGVSVGSLLIASVVLLIFTSIWSARFPRQRFGARSKALPLSVRAGVVLDAKPVAIDVIEKNRFIGKYDKVETIYYDTQHRNITFEFTSFFKHPIYVTAVLPPDDLYLEAKIEENISSSRLMQVRVLDDLTIELVT